MTKETVLTYLETALERALGDIDFAIDWDKRQHTIEVIIALYAENQQHEAIEDDEGVISEEDVIEFQDSTLFYLTDKAPAIDTDEYLMTHGFDKKKGLSKAFIDTYAAYLAEVAETGQSDLLDFLTDDSQAVFELHWHADEFAERLSQVDDGNYVPYPSY